MHYRFKVLAVNIATQPYRVISHARTLTWWFCGEPSCDRPSFVGLFY